MPTVIDATVVNQAYDTSGNGGRKLVRLASGELSTVVFDSSNKMIRHYYSTDNGTTWTQFDAVGYSTTADIAMCKKENRLYYIYALGDGRVIFHSRDFHGSIIGNTIIETGQTVMGKCSLAINEAGTELHAAWASKNSTYPNSFNIRYAKGTINAGGSVTWGSVIQVTTQNTSGYDYKNPSIIIGNDGTPVIFDDFYNGSYFIQAWRWNGTGFASAIVRDGGSYAQSNPSACVDKNGRIWVTWAGMDSTDTDVYNIRVSYSDDGGATWSPMTKLTSGNSYSQHSASITVNKNNEVFIIWSGNSSSDAYNDIRIIKYNGSWGSISIVSSGTTNHKLYPSTLLDATLDFSTPLFIYKDQQGSKVGFYGTWAVTTISVTQGYIGQKTSSDKSNILTYSITTDGEMSDITEKINGTTIATRTNPESGQQFTVSLTQEQWDAIKYGKYDIDTTNLLPDFNNEWTLDSGITRTGAYQLSYNAPSTTKIRASLALTVTPFVEHTISMTINSINSGAFQIDIFDGSTPTKGLAGSAYTKAGDRTLKFTPTQSTVLIWLSNSGITGQQILISNVSVTQNAYKPNTLTIEMGSDIWTYTFDKRLNANDDILSAVKGVQDLQTHLNGIKAQLGAAIRSKGGTVDDTDAWSAFVSAVGNMTNKRWASGTVTSTSSTETYYYSNGATVRHYSLVVNGLTFTPSTIVLFGNGFFTVLFPKILTGTASGRILTGGFSISTSVNISIDTIALTSPASVTSTGFKLPAVNPNTLHEWYAFE